LRENRQRTVRSIAEQVNIVRETVRKINWRSWREEGVCKNDPIGAHRRTKARHCLWGRF
jgi:5'-3' exonuclease